MKDNLITDKKKKSLFKINSLQRIRKYTGCWWVLSFRCDFFDVSAVKNANGMKSSFLRCLLNCCWSKFENPVFIGFDHDSLLSVSNGSHNNRWCVNAQHVSWKLILEKRIDFDHRQFNYWADKIRNWIRNQVRFRMSSILFQCGANVWWKVAL